MKNIDHIDKMAFITSQDSNIESYWTNKLSGDLVKSIVPYDNKRLRIKQEFIATYKFSFIDDIFAKLMKLSGNSLPKVHMILIAGVSLLLFKYSGNTDIIVGTSIYRQEIEAEFINTILVLRNQLTEDMTFKKLLLQVRETLIEADNNQNYPIELLLQKLKIPFSLEDDFPLFDVAVLLENIQDIKHIRWIKPNMLFSFFKTGEVIEGFLEYNSLRYEEDTIERIVSHFSNLMERVLHNVELKLINVDILTNTEKNRLLYEINDTAVKYAVDKTIHDLIEQQMEKTPDNAALVYKKEHIAYRELNKKSKRLSLHLRNKHVKPGIIVGIRAERSIEMIIGIIGILRAGGAYLPIDIDIPANRIKFILEDSQVCILLTQEKFIDKNNFGVQGCSLDTLVLQDNENIFTGEFPHKSFVSHPQDIAYIIYTSGTTGKPKGVMINHQGLVNYACWAAETYLKNRHFDFPLYTSISFDLTVTSIFTPLITGNAVVIYEEPDKEQVVQNIFAEKKVGVLKITPSHLKRAWHKDIKNSIVKCFIFGGEQLDTQLAKDILENFNNSVEIYNEYGPTEAVVGCMIHRFNRDKDIQKSVPVGLPIANVSIYLLDKALNPVPIGVIGEIYIAGHGLARGYLNRVELTLECFIKNPFKRGKKMYKSGDLARWLEDGNLEFLGRKDHQVKIRGYRIELKEIENQLLKHPAIKEAAVLANKMQNDDKYLCAYVVSDTVKKEIEESQIREYLSAQLPYYMIPHYLVQLEKLPLTPNGKLDYKALPLPNLNVGNNYEAPQNDKEKKLVEIWEKVLGLEGIGINDNFFILGGDSIKTIQVAARMKDSGYALEMSDIFKNPTIKELALHIEILKPTEQTGPQAIVTGSVLLTPFQRNFLDNNMTGAHRYWQTARIYFRDRLTEDALRTVFGKLQEHHDALRMTFKEEDGKIIQFNHGLDYPISLRVYDLQDGENVKEALVAAANEIQADIDLGTGPLIRLGLVHLDDGDSLLIAVHHLVIDGVSWRILLEDIDTLYHQYKKREPLKLPLKTESFKSWSGKLSQQVDNRLFLKEKTYWEELESMEISRVKTGSGEENLDSDDVAKLSFCLSKEKIHKLITKTNEAFGTETDDILLTALGLGIKLTFGITRFLIMLEDDSREYSLIDMDIKRTVGCFRREYPVIVDFSFESDSNHLARHIKEIKECLRRIPNKGIGYGILKNLALEKSKEGIGFKLDSQTHIHFFYAKESYTDINPISFELLEEPTETISFANENSGIGLYVSAIPINKELKISVTYNKKQYRTETIKIFLENYQSQLNRIMAYCLNRKERELTPSDLTYKNLSIETLEHLCRQYPLKDIYGLTPLQESMLFYSLYDKSTSSTPYCIQSCYRLSGEWNIPFLEMSLKELVNRHDILRTVFIYEGFERPLQVVLKERPLEFKYLDISKIGETRQEKEAYIKEFEEKGRKRSFDLTKDILMRLEVLQLDRSEYEFIWSFHHILIDGWCVGILITELMEIYQSFLEGRSYRLPEITPFREYIEWLEKQNRECSKKYWQEYLEDYEGLATIPRGRLQKHVKEEFAHREINFILDSEQTLLLKEIASKNQVTMNTVFKALWGISLGKYSGRRDVVFGSVQSGRPPGIKGVETMVGLFLNTIPVRIKYKKETALNELFHTTQEQAIASDSHQHFSLAEIQSNTPLKQNLLDHVLVFQNFPRQKDLKKIIGENTDNDDVRITFKPLDYNLFMYTNYDFYIHLLPGERWVIKFKYNANVYETELIKRIGNYFCSALAQVSYNEKIRVNEIKLLDEEKRQNALDQFTDDLENEW